MCICWCVLIKSKQISNRKSKTMKLMKVSLQNEFFADTENWQFQDSSKFITWWSCTILDHNYVSLSLKHIQKWEIYYMGFPEIASPPEPQDSHHSSKIDLYLWFLEPFGTEWSLSPSGNVVRLNANNHS